MYKDETQVLPSTPEQRCSFLQHIKGFQTLSLTDLQYIAEMLQKQGCKKGHTFFEQGDANNALYFLSKGSVGVFRDEECVAYLQSPDLFGEVGILHEAPRNASVVTLEECEVYVLPGYLLKDMVRARANIQLFFASLTRERS